MVDESADGRLRPRRGLPRADRARRRRTVGAVPPDARARPGGTQPARRPAVGRAVVGHRRRCRARTSTWRRTPAGATPRRCSAATPACGKSTAAQLLGAAAAGAAELGAEPLAAAVADLARRAGVSLARGRRRWRRRRARSTSWPRAGSRPASWRCCACSARAAPTGRSARQLFISAKTASVHVTHILQKLNVTTRVQAAVAAQRLVRPPTE